MKKHMWKRAALLAALGSALCVEYSCTPRTEEAKSTPPGAGAKPTPPSACTLPSAMAASNEQTAWQLFVAANCPVNGQLKWETWTEQACFENPSTPGCSTTTESVSAPVRHLHGSRLGQRLRRKNAAAEAVPATPGPCQLMTTALTAPPGSQPFVPKNLSAQPVFCEEVFVESSEAAFVKAPSAGSTLTNLTAQVAYAKSSTIKFPTSAVEIKADWLPATSLSAAFNCTTNPPAGVYVETISGACYALVGMHISSKLLPNWLWATFEPQNADTNPNRCNDKLYNSCNDPFGSDPATSKGQTTNMTAALTALMMQAGLPKQLFNYRLVGAQSDIVDSSGAAIQLGNSFTEFNAGVSPHQASCMTCHAYAMTSTTAIENPNFSNFPRTPPIGRPGEAPLPAPGGGTWVTQDFSWMLGILPASPPKKN